MQYLLLIYEDEKVLHGKGDDARQDYMREYREFTADIREKGKFVAGDALQPTPTATSVRVRGGKTLTTDGPFAETKEQLGGYYLVDAADLDEAIEIAARIPSAREGTIEVRPIFIYE
ncbi:MAG: YciI family protein [Myxococcota bacterium]